MKLAVTWQMYGYVDIPEATTMKEAMDIFEEECDSIDSPYGELIDGSFTLSTKDVDEMKVICDMY